MKPQRMRLRFLREFFFNLYIVWPVLSGVLIIMVILGFCAARIEEWPFGQGIYFALVTGFTVGYGDVVPHQPLARACAVCIAFLGIVLTAIIAATAVKALGAAQDAEK